MVAASPGEQGGRESDGGGVDADLNWSGHAGYFAVHRVWELGADDPMKHWRALVLPEKQKQWCRCSGKWGLWLVPGRPCEPCEDSTRKG